MANSQQKHEYRKGFTIIEVVLVLAIAGLIFLMVFIALPNMQRSQRDTRRRQEYSTLSAAMTQYMTNNNGNLPTGYNSTTGSDLSTTAAGSITYVGGDGLDPNGNAYKIKVIKCNGTSDGNDCTNATPKATTGTADRQVYVVSNAKCNGAKPVKANGDRTFVIYGYIESAPGTYCQ